MASDISVVIPYHNREQYIDEAIFSVLAQTLAPLEIIIVNDCSTETSRKYLDRYADLCRIIDLASQAGAASARNQGILCARGKFIAFLDDDDVWLPQKLEIQRQYMDQHPECAVVHSAAEMFRTGNQVSLYPCNWSPPLTLLQALTHNYWVILPSMLVRTSVLRALSGFDPRFKGSEDHDFTIRCCAAGYRIHGIPQPLIRIRREGHRSLTRRQWIMFATHLRLCYKHRDLYRAAYGNRGLASFLLSSLQIASSKTRYVDGALRRLMRVLKVKWQVRADYIDPLVEVAKLETPAVSPEVLK